MVGGVKFLRVLLMNLICPLMIRSLRSKQDLRVTALFIHGFI